MLVNIDKEGKEKALPTLEELGITNECLPDMYQMTAKNYNPGLKIPAVFLIDKKGKIVFEAIGENPENPQKLEAAIHLLK